jgi:ADP-ribose pyrophosphatase
MSIPIEQAFQYCPRCATKHDDPGRVPFRCGECGFAVFFGPVAAVGGLIVNATGQLLLVRRARDPGKGKWGLPGGFVDREETIEEALTREVYEETRLRLDTTELLVTFPNRYDYSGVVTSVIDLFYVCRAADPISVELEAAELDEFAWVMPTRAHLDKMAFPSNRRAIEFWMS